MRQTWHSVYLGSMAATVILATIYLAYTGYDYYQLPLEERFYHERHDWFKPSGVYGHGLGIVGTFMMVFGVGIYIARKRYNFMSRFLKLKYLLEFHIFLCVLGPILIVFHTAFKFGGLVSIAFWCMVAVVASGVIGRYIYIQIPRNIQGRALSINELKLARVELSRKIKNAPGMDGDSYDNISSKTKSLLEHKSSAFNSFSVLADMKLKAEIKDILKSKGITKSQSRGILQNIKEEITLGKRMSRLKQMQKIFKYWHVAHLPFALIMLIIVVVHVITALLFGYKWIF